MRVPLSKKIKKYQIKNLQGIVQNIKEPYQKEKGEKHAKKVK